MKVATVFFILIILVLLGICIYNYPDFRRNRRINRHVYATPAVFKDNTEWASFIDAWRELQKMDAWKPETKMAEEDYMFVFRLFIKREIENPILSANPVGILAAHNAKILIDTHYAVGNLNAELARWQNSEIRYVLNRGDYPDDIEECVTDFTDVYYLCDREGRQFAVQEFKRLQEKHLGLADNLPNE